MDNEILFRIISATDDLISLHLEANESLLGPQDGMWEAFRNNATQWIFECNREQVGYACVNDLSQIIQFYITKDYLSEGPIILKSFIERYKIQSCIVGTNNPVFLTAALHFVGQLNVHSYLFRDCIKVNIVEKEGAVISCLSKDVQRIVDFYHSSMGAPKDWLIGYISDLIEKQELFALANDESIIGTFEVRKNTAATSYADIGMIVSPDFRRQGYGTFLLHQAKLKAQEWGRKPICSCEKENNASFKAITNCGFTSTSQLLAIDFK